MPGPPGPPVHLGTPGPLGNPLLALSQVPHLPAHCDRWYPSPEVLSEDVPGGKRSRRGSAAGLGSLVRGRRRGSGVTGQWGFTAGQAGGPLRPRGPGRGGCDGERELPARTQWRRRSPRLSNHARCWLPGKSLLGKKEQIPNHKNFTAAKS